MKTKQKITNRGSRKNQKQVPHVRETIFQIIKQVPHKPKQVPHEREIIFQIVKQVSHKPT